MGIEHRVIEILHRNLPVVLPFTIVGLRLLVKWMAHEEPKLIFRSVLQFPIDLMFIAVGLVLAGLARTIPAFAGRFGSDKDADLAGALMLCGLVLVGVLLTVMDRGVRVLWQKFYTAWQQIGDERKQLRIRFVGDTTPSSGETTADRGTVARVTWMFIYWTALIPLISGESAISVLLLGAVMKKVL